MELEKSKSSQSSESEDHPYKNEDPEFMNFPIPADIDTSQMTQKKIRKL